MKTILSSSYPGPVECPHSDTTIDVDERRDEPGNYQVEFNNGTYRSGVTTKLDDLELLHANLGKFIAQEKAKQ